MTIYSSPSLPSHAVVAHGGVLHLVPLTLGDASWAARKPYHGHRTGLLPIVGGAKMQLIMALTLGIPTGEESAN